MGFQPNDSSQDHIQDLFESNFCFFQCPILGVKDNVWV